MFGIDEIDLYFIVASSVYFKLAILKYETSCAVTFIKYFSPDDGEITPSICKTKPLHGRVCSNKCKPGYTLVGSTSTMCDNGHWTQAGFQCRGKPYSFT